ncbi:TRAP-type C4-dicarboxylate transport system substrate-binding protein [Hasllibacter halocynthiae]|uniref:TRAP-type C4-dicarboxylate transport system substrate-binding protein n=2 Tax=Hasllibacter halocynthiae TaxID=595589 RepID=A0A2T0X9U9_9RHOB|nr:TRAP-type C4-dicarboxylate transport system substrate-binding protein [Hasllibacter halocynthiae]
MLKTTIGAAAFALSALPVAAQDITLTLGHVAPPGSSYQAAAERFAEALDEASGGTMAVDIVPGAALGGLNELWAQLRTDALDLHLIDVGGIIAMREGRPFLVTWAPFLFEDQDHFRRFARSDLFAEMMDGVEAETGVKYLGYVGDRPPRIVTTAETPVRVPNDLRGLTIRTPQHPFVIAAFEAWGASSSPIGAAELLIALRTGVVDGQDNGVIDFVGSGYAEANKHLTPLDYILSGLGLWMSPARWEGMTEEQKGWLTSAAIRAGTDGEAIHEAEMEAAMEALDGLGVTVTEPDTEAFRTAIQPFLDGADGTAWEAGLYERIGGL